MLLLLPPSEGKTAPARGRPVDLQQLSFPELNPVRRRAIAALERLSAGDQPTALEALGLGPRSGAELARNADLERQPAGAAARIYSGVLFDRLDLIGLPTGAKRRAGRRVLITSALWGVVGPNDRIPAYRCPAGVRLPGLPTTTELWREPLRAALPADELVVDLRSGAYRALWTPADAPVVTVDVVREQAGRRTVVSHMAKATRGEIARALLIDEGGSGRDPRTVDGIAERVARAGWTVELGQPDRGGGVSLTVVERV
ncbi:YaaA family protein [Patulibacter defluvii]|uniref:YaaA family protein n=1 Tax=Patulibacter defluvii TaxID=3095358 RepID=UPI002A751D95|nr:peroxide stress protein YaaA [Patulibacter sp. DM4]